MGKSPSFRLPDSTCSDSAVFQGGRQRRTGVRGERTTRKNRQIMHTGACVSLSTDGTVTGFINPVCLFAIGAALATRWIQKPGTILIFVPIGSTNSGNVQSLSGHRNAGTRDHGKGKVSILAPYGGQRKKAVKKGIILLVSVLAPAGGHHIMSFALSGGL